MDKGSKMNKVHFSSKLHDWTTPKDFFEKYNNKYNFVIDAACESHNCLCDNGYCIDNGIDGLKQEWSKEQGYIWCNPPYGRAIKMWIEKAHNEYKKGAKIVLLIPARTDTVAWHKFIFGTAKVDFIKGRLKFGGSKTNAPFPSAIVIFD